MNGPELNPAEEKQLAKLIELQVDTAIEEKHVHEVETREDDDAPIIE